MHTDPAQIHVPVLLQETIEALAPKAGGRYLDGTLGMGGHACALLERVAALGGEPAQLCGLDRDTEALALAKRRLERFSDNVHFFHLRYSQFAQALDTLGWDTLDGALIDIGVSSLQIDSPERGFSFHADGPLDMRMDQQGLDDRPVSELVNRARMEELKNIIATYGEEPQAGRIAAAIVRTRQIKPFSTTRELATVVEQAYPAAWRAKARNHPATRTFQALRMAVNDELGELERFLDAILARLKPGGRLAVIAFHSLEDRVVKHRMKRWAQGCICPKSLPVCVCHHQPEVRILTPRPIQASEIELARNPRASSAKLRAVEKLAITQEKTQRTDVIPQDVPLDVRPRSRRERLQAREEKLRRRGGSGGWL